MDFWWIFWITTLAATGCISIFVVLSFNEFMFVCYAATHRPKFPETDKKFRYAVIIPARDESEVISHSLESLKAQTYDKDYFDVYVIVERKDDPTIEITEKLGYKVLFRTNLENRKRKGYALQEAYEQIKATGIKYDSVMIFDADNIIDKNFIEQLNRVKATGRYEIGMGYRKSTNSQQNWVTGTSTLLFSIMYALDSKGKAHYIRNVTVCGTGYYIDTSVIDKEGGWIWTTLTEDAEITKYSLAKNITCGYNENAILYDEQPATVKQMRKQHNRWVLGFLQASGKYKREKRHVGETKSEHFLKNYTKMMGIFPLAFIIVTPLLYAITCFVLMGLAYVNNYELWYIYLIAAILSLIFIYSLFVFVSVFDMVADRRGLEFKFKFSFKVSLMFMFFFLDFVLAFFRLLNKNNREWDVIKHSGKVTSKGAKKQINKKDKK